MPGIMVVVFLFLVWVFAFNKSTMIPCRTLVFCISWPNNIVSCRYCFYSYFCSSLKLNWEKKNIKKLRSTEKIQFFIYTITGIGCFQKPFVYACLQNMAVISTTVEQLAQPCVCFHFRDSFNSNDFYIKVIITTWYRMACHFTSLSIIPLLSEASTNIFNKEVTWYFVCQSVYTWRNKKRDDAFLLRITCSVWLLNGMTLLDNNCHHSRHLFQCEWI